MNKFEMAYKLVEQDLGCPKKCKICENGFVLYLPRERELISKKFKVPQNKLATSHKIEGHKVCLIAREDKNCIFYKFGKCIKRGARPLDCRSYPAIPILKKGKISIKLDKRCPLVKQNKIKKEFINNALKAWKIVKPQKYWTQIYNKLHSYEN